MIVFCSHAAIDFIKARFEDSLRGFILDQIAHIVVIATLPVLLDGFGVVFPAKEWIFVSIEMLISPVFIHISGLLLTVNAGSFFLTKFVAPYQAQLQQQLKSGTDEETSPLEARRGLKNAGSTIGKLERFLVYVLIHAGQPGGIGFLIAAKSIFRFGELRDTSNRMESEYILSLIHI